MKQLRAGVLGLADGGRFLIEAAAESQEFAVEAVADVDNAVAQQAARTFGCQWFDDYRQFVIGTELDFILAAAPLHVCAEHLKAAMAAGTSVLKLAPAGRNLEQTAEFIRLGKKSGARFRVIKYRRFMPAFLQLRQMIQQEKLGQVHLVEARLSVAGEPGKWRSDPKLAGGGVLLQYGYELVDQVVWNFGMPQQVYALSANTATDRQQRQYLTEESMSATMKLSDRTIGNLVAVKAGTERQQGLQLRIHGREGSIVVNEMDICSEGDQQGFKSQTMAAVAAWLADYAAGIGRQNSQQRQQNLDRDELMNMAVIDCMYLSAKTGFPEEPGEIA